MKLTQDEELDMTGDFSMFIGQLLSESRGLLT
jgi:hypothetical protein